MLEQSKEILLQAETQFAGEQQVAAKTMLGGRLNRRNFLFTAGLTAGALGLTTGCGDVFGVDASSGPAPSVEDVLNFALNLEYLEANFYSYITTGGPISSSLMGTSPGQITGGGSAVAFSDPNVAAVAKQLAADEIAHVTLIRTALMAAGITPVDQPALNLSALGPVTSDATFLALARALETVGTSAYEGGIQYLATNIDAVNYAALVHDTEGQHEGTLRQFCIAKGIASPAVDKYDRPPALSGTGIFNTSPITGFNTARNSSEVLQIVYAAAGKTGVSSGGFYPNGMNGNVKTT